MTDQNTFARFLQPKSVAIVGASPQAGNPRNALVKNLVKHGFQGAVYPVTPSNAEIEVMDNKINECVRRGGPGRQAKARS